MSSRYMKLVLPYTGEDYKRDGAKNKNKTRNADQREKSIFMKTLGKGNIS